MKSILIGLLVVTLLTATGCEMLKGLMAQEKYPQGAESAELLLYRGTQVFKYKCNINLEAKTLTDCQEVK